MIHIHSSDNSACSCHVIISQDAPAIMEAMYHVSNMVGINKGVCVVKYESTRNGRILNAEKHFCVDILCCSYYI